MAKWKDTFRHASLDTGGVVIVLDQLADDSVLMHYTLPRVLNKVLPDTTLESAKVTTTSLVQEALKAVERGLEQSRLHTAAAEVNLSLSHKRLAMAIEAQIRADQAVVLARQDVARDQYSLYLEQICDERPGVKS